MTSAARTAGRADEPRPPRSAAPASAGHPADPAGGDTTRAVRRAAGAAALGCLTGAALLVLTSTPRTGFGALPTEAVSRDFSPGQVRTAAALHSALRPPFYLGLLASTALVVLLGGTRLGGRLAPRRGPRWLRSVVVVAEVSALLCVVRLPTDARLQSLLAAAGLAAAGWSGWLTVTLGAALSTAAVSAVVVAVLQAAARRWPRWWWAGAAVAGALLVPAGAALQPLTTDRLSITVRPMPPSALRTDLLRLAAADHAPIHQIYLGSQTNGGGSENAFVDGLGPTQRVVLYANLVARAPAAEVRVVFAHELGHVVHHDIARGTAEGGLAVAAALCAAPLLLGTRVRRRLGVAGLGDPRAAPTLLAAAAVASLLVSPAQSAISRRVEAAADAHALAVTGDPATFAADEIRLDVVNDAEPRPPLFAVLLFGSHPAPLDRVAMARAAGRRLGHPLPAVLRQPD